MKFLNYFIFKPRIFASPTKLMKDIGYGKNYEYAHDLENKKSDQKHFPDELVGRKYRKTDEK
ncbi:hypothetical protein BLM37_03650 [Candidatus Gracilibacteria bacterium GN02-873]|nr:hypothetical protein BLM37_03650 [Candidatus Gracilibacteria bacterium GN02-873]